MDAIFIENPYNGILKITLSHPSSKKYLDGGFSGFSIFQHLPSPLYIWNTVE
jgi:hypothetical protein